MRSSRRWAPACAAAALACHPAAAQIALPAPTGYVNDFAHVIAPAYADSLRAVSDDVRRKSGGEIVVVTLASLDGHPADEVALQIGREWKVGRKGDPTDRGRATGVVVLLGMRERAWRIETGTGSETFIPAPEAGRIGRDVMVPELRAGNAGRALLLGVDSLAGDYAHHFGFTLASSSLNAPVTSDASAPAHAGPVVDVVPDDPWTGRNLALAIGGGLLFLLAIAGLHRLVRGSTGPQLDHWRRSRRGAPGGRYARDAWDDDRPYDDRPAGLATWGSSPVTGTALLGALVVDDDSSGSGGSPFGGDGGSSIFDGDSAGGSSSDDRDFGGFGGSGDFSGGGSGGTW